MKLFEFNRETSGFNNATIRKEYWKTLYVDSRVLAGYRSYDSVWLKV